MSLSNYWERVNGSFGFLDDARDLICFEGYEGSWDLAIRGLRRPIDRIILGTWIFRSRYFVPIRGLSSFKRLEVTKRILEEL